jgi:MFS family permease
LRGGRTSRGAVVLVGSAVGIAFGSVVFFSAGFTLFSAEWMQAFGWSHAEIAQGASAYFALQAVAYPLAGQLLDRLGSRTVACGSIALLAAGLLALSFLRGSLSSYYALLAFIGVTTAATNAIAYVRAISTWFDRGRGLAIGLATGAQAVGIFVIPHLSQMAIERAGWPSALRLLAALELLVSLPVVAFLVRESQDARVSRSAWTGMPDVLYGSILRSGVFWILAVSVCCEGVGVYAVLPNLSYILRTTVGMLPHEVAAISGATGLSFLLGRLGFGFLLDKLPARHICLVVLAVSVCALLTFAAARTPLAATAAACFLSAAAGGQTDIMPYLAGRYFGVQSVSQVFGLLLVGFFAGSALGPVAFARLAETFALRPALCGVLALQLLPAFLFFNLPPYPALASAARNCVK